MSQHSGASWKEKSYHDKDTNILGCSHYRRNSKLQADCCGKWVVCRLCHDEKSSHIMDRTATKRMVCMFCQTVQQPGQRCSNCSRRMAKYYCDTCIFWDDAPGKDIYHCEGCGICRVGKGPDIDFIHCHDCTTCIPAGNFDSHQCIDYNSKSDCPMCGEYLFTTVKPIMFMKCQHMIHRECYSELLESSFQCPVCFKSLDHAEEAFSAIDKVCQKASSREHLRSISCFDCDQTSIVNVSLLYHKCGQCGSYSTKILDTFNRNYAINIARYNLARDRTEGAYIKQRSSYKDTDSISTLISQMENYDLNDSDDVNNEYEGDKSSQFTCSCSSRSRFAWDSEFGEDSECSCRFDSSSDWNSGYTSN